MKRVLVIEDDDNNYVLIGDLLQHAGYAPLRAGTGEEGVSMALADKPDFVLLDIQLPDIDGYEVLDRIRKSLPSESLPVIAMTSYAMSGDRERLLAAGCNGYIEKPIDPMRVIRQIREIVGEAP
jgi:CheY-like chemotaxis protein